jgi:hypothetical protein
MLRKYAERGAVSESNILVVERVEKQEPTLKMQSTDEFIQ